MDKKDDQKQRTSRALGGPLTMALALAAAFAANIAGTAQADGPLQIGEIVFTGDAEHGHPKLIGRADPTVPGAFEEITDYAGDSIPAEAVAIADRYNVYAVEADSTNLKFLIWRVGVQSGLMTLIDEVLYDDYGWYGGTVYHPRAEALEVEPDGRLLLLVAGHDGVGHILRFDPTLDENQVPEVVIASNLFQVSLLRNDMKVAATGDIYVSDATGVSNTYRVQNNAPLPNTFVPVWDTVDPGSYGNSMGVGRALEIDPLTGHLLLVCVWFTSVPPGVFEICSADPMTSVLNMVPTGVGTDYRETIAKGMSGDIITSFSVPADDVEFVLPECSDGIDNDSDGATDFPNDVHCTDLNDDQEATPPECSDNADNDGDGLTDYPADPDCVGPGDNRELYKAPKVGCRNSISPTGGTNTSLTVLMAMAALGYARRRAGYSV